MTAPGNDLLYFVLTLCVFVSSGYAVGRIHQWHRQGLERDEAYRVGYNKASRSIVGMMNDQNFISPELDATAGDFAMNSRSRHRADPAPGHRAVVNQRQAYPAHRVTADRARTGPRPGHVADARPAL